MTRSHLVWLAAALLLATSVFLAGQLAWAVDPSATSILAHSADAEVNLPHQGVRRLASYGDHGRVKMVITQRISQGRGGMERIETLAPASHAGSLTVSDGRTLWEYHPQRRYCIQRTLPSQSELASRRALSLKRISRLLLPQYLGTQKFLGRPVYVVRIVDPRGLVLRLAWVDKATALELASEEFAPDGSVESLMRYDSVSFAPATDKSLFTFRPPAGVKVQAVKNEVTRLSLTAAEKRVGFRVLLPTYLPPGYILAPEETSVTPGCGGPALCLVFTNGLYSLSLFQARCGAKDPAPHLGQRVSCWRSHGLAITLIGSLAASDIRKLSRSLQPRSG